MYPHIYICIHMFQDRESTIDIAFPTKNRAFQKLASIFKWYHVGEIFQQGWHDSSRDQGMGGAAQWLQWSSCCGAKRALNAKPLRFFPNGGEEGRGSSPPF